jgi:hypothetical protein
MSNSRRTAALKKRVKLRAFVAALGAGHIVLKRGDYRATSISDPLLESATLIFGRLALVLRRKTGCR